MSLMFLTSLLYLLLISAIYFSKEKINTIENRIYSMILAVNIFGLIYDFFQLLLSEVLSVGNLIIINKGFLIYVTAWALLFSLYVMNIGNKDRIHLINTHFMVWIACILLIIILPESYKINSEGIPIVSGPALVFTFGFVSAIIIFLLIATIVKMFKNKNTNKFKYIPLFAFLIFGSLGTIIQHFNPNLLLTSPVEAFITILTYFFIENPDVKMLEQTELAREQAEKANRAKTDFLSSMSHEIRTPLNAIVGFSDCIQEAKTLEEAKENSKDIINASQTLLEIVNGILDISKIEAGKIEIVNSPYNAPETFEELAKLITPKMNEKSLDFSYYIAPDIPKTLYGDHANVKKVITNFLSNAYKYTEKGFVRYEVNCINTKDVCKLIITVEDSGRGIKKENIDKMFTKFQRLDEDRNTTIEGTGLGLAITKQLVELMGGKIIVHTVYGEGSKFTVVLNQRIELEQPEENTHKVSTKLDLNNVKILLVDDNTLNIKVANKLLERYGANMITSIDNGFECIDRIKAGEQYDIILLDDMMPKMSGVETLQKLKEIPNFHIPVVALTANAITGMKEKYLADGFDNYLAKPMEKEQLIQVLNEILGRTATEEIPVKSIEEASTEEVVDKNSNENSNKQETVENDRKKEIIPVEESVEEIVNETNGELVSLSGIKTKELLQRGQEAELLEVTQQIPKVEEQPKVEEKQEEVNIPVVEEDKKEEVEELKESNNIYDRKYLEINGVDVEHGLELLGDMEMYNMTINDFAKEVEAKWSRIIDYKRNNDLANYAIEVHSLKSDSKYLGFMKLADISYQHELKSKENDADYINNHFVELNNEYEKILEIVKNYVSQNKTEE